MGYVQNSCLYIRYRHSSTKPKVEGAKNKKASLFYGEIYSQSSSNLSQVWENQTRRFWFCSSSFFLSSSTPSCRAQKLWGVYKCSTSQTTALLMKMCLFWFRAACELQLTSYSPKHAPWSLSTMLFHAYFQYNSKTMATWSLPGLQQAYQNTRPESRCVSHVGVSRSECG